MESGAFAAVAFAPSGIQLDGFVCVSKGILEVAERGVAGGAVRVEHIVRGVEANRLCGGMEVSCARVA
jgi:hypothetical protein